MRTLSHCFIVGHVHDELIIETPMDADLTAICEQMGRTPKWIDGLLLRADGYETAYFEKFYGIGGIARFTKVNEG